MGPHAAVKDIRMARRDFWMRITADMFSGRVIQLIQVNLVFQILGLYFWNQRKYLQSDSLKFTNVCNTLYPTLFWEPNSVT